MIPGPKRTDLETCDCIINDGNALIQSLQPPTHVETFTFKNMADKFFQAVMSIENALESNEVHIVLDR